MVYPDYSYDQPSLASACEIEVKYVYTGAVYSPEYDPILDGPIDALEASPTEISAAICTVENTAINPLAGTEHILTSESTTVDECCTAGVDAYNIDNIDLELLEACE